MVVTVINAALCVGMLVIPEGIDEVSGLQPDSGSGARELIIAGAFLFAVVPLLPSNVTSVLLPGFEKGCGLYE